MRIDPHFSKTWCTVAWAAVLFLIAAGTHAQAPLTFAEMKLDGVVTSMAATEDGQFLVLCHESISKVTIWDVRQNQVVKVLPVASPGTVICRGDKIFIGQCGKGQVRVLSRGQGWQAVDDLKVKYPDIYWITAPQGKAFADWILVAATGSDGHMGIEAVNALTNESRVVASPMDNGQMVVPILSANGRRLLYQGIRPQIGLDFSADLLSLDANLNPQPALASRVDVPATLVYQHGDDDFWFSGRVLLTGEKLTHWATPLGRLTLPDQTGPCAYGIDPDRLHAYHLGTIPQEVGSRPLTLPPALLEEFNGPAHRAVSNIQFDQDMTGKPRRVRGCWPVAVTLDRSLHLFLPNLRSGIVYHTQTEAFADQADQPNQSAQTHWSIAVPAGHLQPVTLPAAASDMALSEDGTRLAIAHFTTDCVTIWDVAHGDLLVTIATPAPRALLCRGNKVVVANFGHGTVSTFALDTGKPLEQVHLDVPRVMHLSAPQGSWFHDELLAVAAPETLSHIGGAECPVYWINLGTSEIQTVTKVATGARPVVDYQGTTVISAEFFRLGCWDLQQYRSGHLPEVRPGPERYSGTPLFQTAPNGLWFGTSALLAGFPPSPVGRGNARLGTPLPDVKANRFYGLTAHSLCYYSTQVPFDLLGEIEITVDPAIRRDTAGHPTNRLNEKLPMFRYGVAATLGRTVHLFALLESDNLACGEVATPSAPDEDLTGSAAQTQPASQTQPVSPTESMPDRVAEGLEVAVRLVPADAVEAARFTVASGPTGVSISADGLLHWTPGPAEVGPQSIKVKVDTGDQTAFIRLKTEVVAAKMSALLGGNLRGADQLGTHVLLQEKVAIAPTLDGTGLLLLQGNLLSLMDRDGLVAGPTRALPGRYQGIRERQGYYLLSGDCSIALVDKQDLHLIRAIALPASGMSDIVPDPVRPVTYVVAWEEKSVYAGSRPATAVQVVDEAHGTFRTVAGADLRHLVADPRGRFLIGIGKQGFSEPWKLDLTATPPKAGPLNGFRFQDSDPVLSPDGAEMFLFEPQVISSDPNRKSGFFVRSTSNPAKVLRFLEILCRGWTLVPDAKSARMAATDNRGESVIIFDARTGRRFDNLTINLSTLDPDVTDRDMARLHPVLFTPGGNRILIEYLNTRYGGHYLRSVELKKP